MKYLILITCVFLSVTGLSQDSIYYCSFENGLQPDCGTAIQEESSGGSMSVVSNPLVDAVNGTATVLRVSTTEASSSRAEYSRSRDVVDEKKFIYSWYVYHPATMFDGINLSWLVVNQWKTYPCEDGGELDDKICYGGGIYNDIEYEQDYKINYRSRAENDCNSSWGELPTGRWVRFVKEIYWTNTENGYFRIWVDDELFGYSDHVKTLFDNFPVDGHCNVYWSVGLYSDFTDVGSANLTGYIDELALYEISETLTIADVCPDCESAPAVRNDTNIYKIDIGNAHPDSMNYTNYIKYYSGDTNKLNPSSTFGRSTSLDFYMFSDATQSSSSVPATCFPHDVAYRFAYWSDSDTRQILIDSCNSTATYDIKIFSATTANGDHRGIQIWNGAQRDTCIAADNECNEAILTGLIPDVNGQLIINIKSISDATPYCYFNAITILEILPQAKKSGRVVVRNGKVVVRNGKVLIN